MKCHDSNKREAHFKWGKVMLGAALLFIFIVVGYYFLTLWMRADLGGFTADSATSTTMHVLKRRILVYAKENNKLPGSIEELPELEGFTNRITDGWGWPITMKINDTEVSLISYGKDNKLGGESANLDFVNVFEARNLGNEWADENDESYHSWKKRSTIRWDKSGYQ